MEKVRDRLWMWGHEAGSHNRGFGEWVPSWGLTKSSRMTPLEGAVYLGVPNLIFVRYEDQPPMPFDQYAIPFRALKQVFWSVVGGAGWTSAEEQEHVLELASRFPNITGIFLDDFFNGDGRSENPAVLAPDELSALRGKLPVSGRKLSIGATFYRDLLGAPLQNYLKYIDLLVYFTWMAQDLANLEQNFIDFEASAQEQEKFLGLYMWDYGAKRPMPPDLMQRQAEMGLTWLLDGRIGGIVFLASCICDLELEAVEWCRNWINRIGDEELIR